MCCVCGASVSCVLCALCCAVLSCTGGKMDTSLGIEPLRELLRCVLKV